MVSSFKKNKSAGNGESKTLVSKGSTCHNASTTYTREEIKLLMKEYYPHRLDKKM